ncbi:MAG: glycosyltransferase [Candidatus Aenigmarchaeota archaeon]|nr:glycosyltransferase [Candidatus Aenigmarchaeota archaeon]
MVTIVLPTKNEEESIGKTIDEIRSVTKESMLVVDGHSKDKTVEIAKKRGVPVIYDHGLGKGEALRTAFTHAKDDVVFLDVDGTYPINLLPEFIDALKTHDVVVGERTKFLHKSLPRIFLVSDAVSRGIFRILFGKRIDNLSGMRGITKNAIKKMSLKSNGFTIESEMAVKTAVYNMSLKKIPITYDMRKGSSKFNPLTDGTKIFFFLMFSFFYYKLHSLMNFFGFVKN